MQLLGLVPLLVDLFPPKYLILIRKHKLGASLNDEVINCGAKPKLLFLCVSVCKGAKADVVFLIDGSWSIGEDSFHKVRQFVFSIIGAFDVIGPSGMQVWTNFLGNSLALQRERRI